MIKRASLIIVLLLSANLALTKDCGKVEELMADAIGQTFDIGNEQPMIEADYTCQWKINPVKEKTGKILLRVIGTGDPDAANQCINVSTEPLTPENKQVTKLCAKGDLTELKTEKAPVYVSYPATKPNPAIKSFQFYYELSEAALTGQCAPQEALIAVEKQNTFTIGNPSLALGKEYKCEWQIQPTAGFTGEIDISVTSTTEEESSKQCIGVTTEAPNTPGRKATKVCAKQKHTSTVTPVYILYPAGETTADTKSFEVSYQLTKAQQVAQCQNPIMLTATSNKMEFTIGDGAQIASNYKCEWQVTPAAGQTGDIEISVVKSNDGDGTTQCVDVTTEAPSNSNTNGQNSGAAQRNTMKLCATGGVSSYRSGASKIYVLYPPAGTTNSNKPFKVSYQMTNAPLTGQCPKPAPLMAETEQKTFPIGDGKHDLAEGYTCEWEIKKVEGKFGSIEVSVNKSTDGEAANQCVDVTTVAANSANANGQTAQRNQTKLCADGTGSPYLTSTSPVFVIYPAAGNTKQNKPFHVAYKFNSSIQLRSSGSYFLLLIFSVLMFQS